METFWYSTAAIGMQCTVRYTFLAMTSKLAVITVTFSPGRHLQALIDSVPAATTRPTTVFLADNGSTDGSPQAAAAANNNVVFFPTGGNIGYGAAINAAYRQVRSLDDAYDPDYIVIVNPDVTFEPGAIDALIDCAQRHPRAGAVGPQIRDPEGTVYPSARAIPTLRTGIGHAVLGRLWPANPWTTAYKDSLDMQRERTSGWLSGSCLLLRREAFDQVGGFDERYFMYMEDVDLGDRLARAGWSNVYTPQARIVHDQGHVATRYSAVTLPAHHASVYRFLADRLPAWWQAPLRAALWVGLRVRCAIFLRRAATR